MSKTILGIDPGMYGALSFYDGDELVIYDMPVFKRNKTKRLDYSRLDGIMELMIPVDHAFIEQVNAFGMGASSAYNFGWTCGMLEALILSRQIPLSYITPQVWKKEMQCPKEKEGARMRASQLLPKQTHQWTLKKHHGRAESALIAMYGRNKLM